MFYKVTLGFTTGATYNMTNVHVFKAAQARRAYFYLYVLLFLQHGADANKKNRDGHTPLDLVKDGDTDVQDLLRGEFITILRNVGVLGER